MGNGRVKRKEGEEESDATRAGVKTRRGKWVRGKERKGEGVKEGR